MAEPHLDFEKPARELSFRIDDLRSIQKSAQLDLSEEISTLAQKAAGSIALTYKNLSPWMTVQVARHAQRPHTLDYIRSLIIDFTELHGDRGFADDPAIVGGIGRFDGVPMIIVGHQKGRDTKERMHRNFGMPRPEGYRKAIRLMKLAERFNIPLLTLVDTPGAYPGIDAEEHGQSAAIGECILVMSQLTIPTLSIVIGEGGSGGALAIAIADEVHMLEYSTYSVISPEGCASILWRDPAYAEVAADALGMTAARLKKLHLIDGVVPEPVGGAQADPAKAAEYLGRVIHRFLGQVEKITLNERLAKRESKIRGFGISTSLP